MNYHLLLLSGIFLLILLITLARPNNTAATEADRSGPEKATFAGGCFWCMEKPFQQLAGVLSVTAGYTGGRTENPTYENYGAGGHIEAVEITYDPTMVSYDQLLDIFWRQIDPTDAGGQFVDRGHEYSTAVFYHNEAQRKLAEISKKNLEDAKVFAKPIITPILRAAPFYRAEDYHQDYYKKNPLRYKFYRYGSGRDKFLQQTWRPEKTAEIKE